MSPKKKKKVTPRKKVSLPPGSLIYKGNVEDSKSILQLHHFNEKEYTLFEKENYLSILKKAATLPGKKWLKIVGLNQIDTIRQIGKIFHIDSLVLEDILDTAQRPKCNVSDNYMFFTLKKFYGNNENPSVINFQQISILLTDQLMISFHEKEDDWLKHLTEKLAKEDSILRAKSIDYLFYRCIDTIVDHYFIEIEKIEERIEDLELKINEKIEDNDLQKIQQLKRDLILLRKNITPVREAISTAKKKDHPFLKEVNSYMLDVYDHILHITETIETYRDITSGLMELYMTGISNRMNGIMKVLTIISTIFIPLTFIVGVYGMNFQYTPELTIKWADPIILSVMGILALLMLLYFKRKKWL